MTAISPRCKLRPKKVCIPGWGYRSHTPHHHTHSWCGRVVPCRAENRPTGCDGSRSPWGMLASLAPACPQWPVAEGWSTRARVKDGGGLGAGDQNIQLQSCCGPWQVPAPSLGLHL